MKCPHCNKEVRISAIAELNMESYHETLLVKTICCGNLVNTYPAFSFYVSKYKGDKREDSFGESIDD